MADDFSAEVAQDGDATVIHLAGEIDIATCERLRDVIEPHLGPAQTIAMITGMEVLVTAQLLPGASRHADWPFVLWMAVPAAVLMPVGLWFLQRVDADLIARIIGGIIVSFVVVLATGWRYRGSRRLPLTMAVGSLSGFMMAATSIGLPPVVLYMFSGMETATTHRANVIAFIALTMVALITVLAAGGLVTREVLLRAALLMLPYVLTIWVGTRLFSQSSEKLYRYIALTVLFIVGMTALLR